MYEVIFRGTIFMMLSVLLLECVLRGDDIINSFICRYVTVVSPYELTPLSSGGV
jgi:hypothetical protein